MNTNGHAPPGCTKQDSKKLLQKFDSLDAHVTAFMHGVSNNDASTSAEAQQGCMTKTVVLSKVSRVASTLCTTPSTTIGVVIPYLVWLAYEERIYNNQSFDTTSRGHVSKI